MRPSFFHARSVASCVRQSTRLWTCIRSIRSTRKSSIERRICAMPASRPRVHTLVAINALSCAFIVVSNSPTTVSAAPYIGDESITEPPLSNRIRRTSSSWVRSAGPWPTSKVRHVPQPTSGSGARFEGIGRVCILSLMAGFAQRISDAAHAEVAPTMSRRNSVRVIAKNRKCNPTDCASRQRITGWGDWANGEIGLVAVAFEHLCALLRRDSTGERARGSRIAAGCVQTCTCVCEVLRW